MKKLVYLLFGLCTLWGITGCSDDEEVGGSGEVVVGVDLNGTSTHEVTVYDAIGQGHAIFYDFSDYGLQQVVLVEGEEGKPCTIAFNEDNLPESFSMDSTVVVFSNYREDLVDMVCICGEQIVTKEDIPLTPALRERMRASSLRADGIFGFFESADEFLREAQPYFETISLAIDLFTDAKTMLTGQVDMDKLAALVGHIKSITDGTLMVTDAGNQYAALGGDAAYEVFKSKITGKPTGKGVWLLTILSNYRAVSDFFEAAWLQVFEWWDAYNTTAKVNMGKGILETGQGQLKATLSWGFYADLDLHAIEPTGEHLYFRNKYSISTDGYLDRDNRNGGSNATENIFWENPPEGVYHFYIHYYGGSLSTNRYETGTCYLYLNCGQTKKLFSFQIDVDEWTSVISIKFPEGNINITRAPQDILFSKEPKE